MLDLWLHRPGGANLSALERPALGAQTSWHALAALSGDGGVLDLGGGKDAPLFAALNDDEEIVVVGPRPNEVDEGDEGGSWGYGGGFYPGGPTEPGVSEGGGEQLTEPAKDTPCVEAAPNGVELQELNNQALRLSNGIASRNDEMWEYGVIFYMKDGVLQNTGVFGGGQPGNINWNLGFPLVPNGAVIVAILHNHPDDPSVNDAIPSLNTMQNPGGQDWLAFDSFLSVADRNSRGITTDSNLLMYIYTNEDHKTRVYDKTDRNTTQKSCSLQA